MKVGATRFALLARGECDPFGLRQWLVLARGGNSFGLRLRPSVGHRWHRRLALRQNRWDRKLARRLHRWDGVGP